MFLVYFMLWVFSFCALPFFLVFLFKMVKELFKKFIPRVRKWKQELKYASREYHVTHTGFDYDGGLKSIDFSPHKKNYTGPVSVEYLKVFSPCLSSGKRIRPYHDAGWRLYKSVWSSLNSLMPKQVYSLSYLENGSIKGVSLQGVLVHGEIIDCEISYYSNGVMKSIKFYNAIGSHNVGGPALTLLTINNDDPDEHYAINGKALSKEDWLEHPLVQEHQRSLRNNTKGNITTNISF